MLFQSELLSFCRDHGVRLQGYASLGSGAPDLLEHPVAVALAKELHLTVGEVLVRRSRRRDDLMRLTGAAAVESTPWCGGHSSVKECRAHRGQRTPGRPGAR
jgi:diketogulonate reductase-like aldo/keto reductase